MKTRTRRAPADIDYLLAPPLGWCDGGILVWAGMCGAILALLRQVGNDVADSMPRATEIPTENHAASRRLALAIIVAQRNALLDVRDDGSYAAETLNSALVNLDAEQISLELRGRRRSCDPRVRLFPDRGGTSADRRLPVSYSSPFITRGKDEGEPGVRRPRRKQQAAVLVKGQLSRQREPDTTASTGRNSVMEDLFTESTPPLVFHIERNRSLCRTRTQSHFALPMPHCILQQDVKDLLEHRRHNNGPR